VSRFRYRCPMRWGDLDAQGHVNNAVYLDYLQEARVEFLLDGPPIMHDLLATGVLVVAHQVEYLRPLAFDTTPVEIELWVQAVGGSRFEIGYDVNHQGRLVGRARTGAVPFDLVTGRLRRLLPDEREQLAVWRDAAEPLRSLTAAPAGRDAHRFALRVRWSDLDSYGHVNNVKFFDYIQEARLALMAEALGFAGPDLGTGEIWVVARQDVEYLRPLDFRREAYEVATTVAALGNRSFTLGVELRDPLLDTRNAYATARTIVVGPATLTDDQRGALSRWSAR
jgi:acyl-CoA thioester hydrolase